MEPLNESALTGSRLNAILGWGRKLNECLFFPGEVCTSRGIQECSAPRSFGF